MYIFVLYFIVYLVNGVELHSPKYRRVKDKAADTAKLIHIVQNADNFVVKYPVKSKSKNGTNEDINEDVDIFETMKLLQKNYDVKRKYNEIPKKARLQHISNPEVLERYKHIAGNDKTTEAYDDLDISDIRTPRSYYKELTETKNFRANERSKKKITVSSKKGKKINKRRHIENGENAKDTGSNGASSSEHSLKKKEYNETFNLVKPIVIELLSKFAEKAKEEKEKSIQKIFEMDSKEEKNNDDSGSKGSETKNIKDKSQEDSDGEKLKDISKVIITENSKEETEANDSQNKDITTKRFTIDPTVTIEDNGSQEKKHDENNNDSNDKVKSNENNDEDDHHSEQNESKPNNIRNPKETDNENTNPSMEEHDIDWGDYKESNKKADADNSKASDNLKLKLKKAMKKILKDNMKKLDEHVENDAKKLKSHNSYKPEISTKRKGEWADRDDNWDKKNSYDDKFDSIKKVDNRWNNQNDDREPKNDYNKNYESDSNRFDKKKGNSVAKKEINWGNDDDDFGKKDNKLKDKFDEAPVKKIKKNDWNTNDENMSKGNVKRDSSWDTVGVNKQKSSWGNYDTYNKGPINKKTNYKESMQAEVHKPKIEYKLPKYNNYEPKRDNYYDKPSKNRGRMGNYRTPIPIVGKRPLYAD